MRTVDDPESPDISPDGRKVAFAALQGGTGDIFVVDLADAGSHQRHQGSSSPIRARPGRRTAARSSTWRASARTRSCSASTSTPAGRRSSPSARMTTRTAKFLDADTLVFLVHRDRPDAADRPGGRAQRQHLQHLDAEPEDRRAAAVHRRRRRQPLRRGREGRRLTATRSASSATTRRITSCTRSSAASRSSPPPPPTSASPAR